MTRSIIETDAAPAAIGTYSQAVRAGSTVYISGQIPLDPKTQQIAGDDFATQCTQVFENLIAICAAAGGSARDVVKLTVYMVDLGHFAAVNEIMARYFDEPYPARAAIQVAALPKNVQIEIDAIVVLDD